ncbi:hypothetical protein C8Q77DRAFT_1127994 [Trametes polyzona]|nr:hypothetical protein C8Q77DRAFT_1127994 [Trametes polyzona]
MSRTRSKTRCGENVATRSAHSSSSASKKFAALNFPAVTAVEGTSVSSSPPASSSPSALSSSSASASGLKCPAASRLLPFFTCLPGVRVCSAPRSEVSWERKVPGRRRRNVMLLHGWVCHSFAGISSSSWEGGFWGFSARV